jgi:hypothetical protein
MGFIFSRIIELKSTRHDQLGDGDKECNNTLLKKCEFLAFYIQNPTVLFNTFTMITRINGQALSS